MPVAFHKYLLQGPHLLCGHTYAKDPYAFGKLTGSQFGVRALREGCAASHNTHKKTRTSMSSKHDSLNFGTPHVAKKKITIRPSVTQYLLNYQEKFIKSRGITVHANGTFKTKTHAYAGKSLCIPLTAKGSPCCTCIA